MKKLSSNEIRDMFLKYFEAHGHMIEPSASLIPHNDPTLLWINSGVAALKKYFDGTEKPKSHRITNAQKSIRTNDIENVGRTARHHTFFEMLGNFSIGDYFKKEAIHFAWELLTSPEWFHFEKEKLYVTVYPDDEEAYRIWVDEIQIDPSHILKSEENYWEIGDGPSGPNSEIYYDRGEKYDPEGIGERLFLEEIENDRYVEIWNIVFSQYDAKVGVARKDYKELPQKNIDTGMGFERLVSVIQEGETNFDTDLFLPIISEIEKIAKFPYEGEYKMAYRVICDHIRTITFALADGALFSNEGRGYVLRRVLRRAVRYGRKLGIETAFMYHLVQTVSENMNYFYPYLMEKIDLTSKLVKTEELAFHTTLKNGEKLLKEALQSASDTKVLSGEIVFKLYDTYGFPKELTMEIAKDSGFDVDLEGFDEMMAQQQERARSSRHDEQSMNSQSEDLMNFKEESTFIGYDHNSVMAKVIGLFIDGKQVDELTQSGDVILDKTCFYAESGGQVGDTGILEGSDFKAKVVDCKKTRNQQNLHKIEIEKGVLKVGDTLQGSIDIARRDLIRANHSSLHLLNKALHDVLGNHINQAGSFCSDEYARFDFTHFEKITHEQLREIETIVNQNILRTIDVKTHVLPIEEALKIGAIALFDEKYGDIVRVVDMEDASKEFCGGTHVKNTQDIGVFKIISEESIGSGTRRIVSKTKYKAYEVIQSESEKLYQIAGQLDASSINQIDEKLNALKEAHEILRKEFNKQKNQMLQLKVSEFVTNAQSIHEMNVVIMHEANIPTGDLKALAENINHRLQNGFVFIVSKTDDKLGFVCVLSDFTVNNGYHAGNIIKAVAAVCEGKGGGKPQSAQGGGKAIVSTDAILTLVTEMIQN